MARTARTSTRTRALRRVRSVVTGPPHVRTWLQLGGFRHQGQPSGTPDDPWTHTDGVRLVTTDLARFTGSGLDPTPGAPNQIVRSSRFAPWLCPGRHDAPPG